MELDKLRQGMVYEHRMRKMELYLKWLESNTAEDAIHVLREIELNGKTQELVEFAKGEVQRRYDEALKALSEL